MFQSLLATVSPLANTVGQVAKNMSDRLVRGGRSFFLAGEILPAGDDEGDEINERRFASEMNITM